MRFWTGSSRCRLVFVLVCVLSLFLTSEFEECCFFLREVPLGSGAVRDDVVSSPSTRSIRGASTSSVFL